MALENYFIYRLGLWLTARLPLWLVYAGAALLADLNFLFSARIRRGIYANLGRAVPPDTSVWRRRWLCDRVFRNFAYSTADFFRVPQMNAGNLDRFVSQVSGWEHLQAALKAHTGGIFVTVHMGSWELAAAYLALRGTPLTAVALPHQDKRIDRIFIASREAVGMEVIPTGGALRKMGEALNAAVSWRSRPIGMSPGMARACPSWAR